jgi:hypothetical protein
MHLLMYVAIALAVLSIFSFVGSTVSDGRASHVWLASSSISMVVAAAIVGALIFGQRPICRALGGTWVPESQACMDEWRVATGTTTRATV